jgi:spermidine/putrescine transport system permease protein
VAAALPVLRRPVEATGGRRRSRVAPYVMVLPALAYLAVFFVVPLWSLLRTSLSRNTGSVFLPTLSFDWAFTNYGDAFTDFRDQIVRSFLYAGVATLICLVLAYPLAYVIAFKAGRYRNLLLGLVILPFFVTFLVRTLAWKTILSDDGWVVAALDTAGLLPSEGRLLSTSWAVVGGLVYNFLPFMVLPLYVSLEKIDVRLVEAAGDLYSTSWRGFRKVVVPLSMPGVLAGSLLVFIPAAGDFINAQYLGGTQNTMIGNVIQRQFLVVKDYPAAAALSFVLMAVILAAVLAYTRALGTDDLV